MVRIAWGCVSVYWHTVWCAGGLLVLWCLPLLLLFWAWFQGLRQLHGQWYSHVVYACTFTHVQNFILLSICGVCGVAFFRAFFFPPPSPSTGSGFGLRLGLVLCIIYIVIFSTELLL